MKKTMIAALLAAPVALSVAAAPAASADEPGIPVDILPYIQVPPFISGLAPQLGTGIRDIITDNPGPVGQGSGIIAGVSCAVLSLFGRACPPVP